MVPIRLRIDSEGYFEDGNESSRVIPRPSEQLSASGKQLFSMDFVIKQ